MNYFRLLQNLYQMKRNEGKTREQLRRLQEKKLRKLLLFAYENSAYYHRTFEQAGITGKQIPNLPLNRFPSIDKREFLEHFDELVTIPGLSQEELRRFDEEEPVDRQRFRDNCHVVHSSGSTGKPGYFVYDEKAWNEMLVGIIRAALWNMTMPQILKMLSGGLRIVYIAATDGRYGGAMAVGDGIKGVHASQLFLDIKTPLEEWVVRIQKFRPNMIIGYPSAIKILGELTENGNVKMEVLRVISCGEPLSEGLRSYLEHVFSARVVNIYGASESLALGVETDPAEGMVLFDDLNYIEVENGNMYLTSLYNYAQPLIRYRISDRICLMEGQEGRCPFTRAESIRGRNEDLLWFMDGTGKREFLHPLAIEGFCIEEMLDYQFRQTENDTFEMLVEVSDSTKKDFIHRQMMGQMRSILSEKQLDYVQFYVRFVEHILPDPRTGKKPLITA